LGGESGMIEINVTGDTYSLRKGLKENGFYWVQEQKCWRKIVTEATLNNTLEAIRPPVSWSEKPFPRLAVTLKYVSLDGRMMSDKVLRIFLKPVGERGGVDFLGLFQKEMSEFKLSPTAPSPSDTEEDEGQSKIDDEFF